MEFSLEVYYFDKPEIKESFSCESQKEAIKLFKKSKFELSWKSSKLYDSKGKLIKESDAFDRKWITYNSLSGQTFYLSDFIYES